MVSTHVEGNLDTCRRLVTVGKALSELMRCRSKGWLQRHAHQAPDPTARTHKQEERERPE